MADVDIELIGAKFHQSMGAIEDVYYETMRRQNLDDSGKYARHVNILAEMGVKRSLIPQSLLDVVSFYDFDDWDWCVFTRMCAFSLLRDVVFPSTNQKPFLTFSPMEIVGFLNDSGMLSTEDMLSEKFLASMNSSETRNGLAAVVIRNGLVRGKYAKINGKGKIKAKAIRVFSGMKVRGIENVEMFDLGLHYIVTGENYTLEDISYPYNHIENGIIDTPFFIGKVNTTDDVVEISFRADGIERDVNDILASSKSVGGIKDPTQSKQMRWWSPNPDFDPMRI